MEYYYGDILSAIFQGSTAPVGCNGQRRAPPHCGVVNLVRSGRKQPQLLTASAGDKARHLSRREEGGSEDLPSSELPLRGLSHSLPL